MWLNSRQPTAIPGHWVAIFMEVRRRSNNCTTLFIQFAFNSVLEESNYWYGPHCHYRVGHNSSIKVVILLTDF
uniref:Uncharacterized protein n=1 Tax=Cucumis melo TaxID=3656 RepID=A0A9I9EN18_CUCME